MAINLLYITGLYTEISPRGAKLGYGQKRGRNWGMDKSGGAKLGYGQKRGVPGGSSVVSCEVLHSRGRE